MTRPAPARVPSRPAPNAPLRVVRRRSRNLIRRGDGRRVAPLAVLAGICALAIVFGVLLEQVVLAQSAFRLARIRHRLVQAEERHERLMLQVAGLESPERIERFARERLGMVEPRPEQLQYVVADVRSRAERRAVADAAPDAPPRAGAQAAPAPAAEDAP